MAHDRPSFFKFARDIGVCLLIIIVLTLMTACASVPSGPMLEFKHNGNTFRLYSQKCENDAIAPSIAKFMAMVPPQFLSMVTWQTGAVTYKGVDYETCWTLTPTQKVFMFFPDGDISVLNMSDFSKPGAKPSLQRDPEPTPRWRNEGRKWDA